MATNVADYLGAEAPSLLEHTCKVPKDLMHLPGPDFVDRVVAHSDRSNRVLASLARIHGHGRLGGTGYLSILPVDQGIEHTGGASFAPNPIYFDPENIVRLALAGDCNATASTLGVLGSISRKYAHKIPMICKLNHNELLTYPLKYDQRIFASVQRAWNLGAAAVGSTIYYGSPESSRQIEQTAAMFEQAHSLGMATVLWCYLRHGDFKTLKVPEGFAGEGGTMDGHLAADASGQANHLGVTIQADFVKQKQAECNGAFEAIKLGRVDKQRLMYTELCSDHPIDLTRYQVINCYMGRVGMINSGGASGDDDFAQAVRTAVINKRAGGTGLISGRKAFQRPMDEGAKLLHTIQDVFLDESVTVA